MRTKPVRFLCLLLVLLLLLSAPLTLWAGDTSPLPSGFVYVEQVIPDIKLDIRYATSHNFLGTPVDGYVQPKCILTTQAAQTLKLVQDDLRPFGLGLKVFDGYRPQRAVDHFVRWAKDLNDTRMKSEFYPNVNKENLFKDGYIASKSGHSRGSTVDLTITSLAAKPNDPGLDMGSNFDFFGPPSWPLNQDVPTEARAHRMLLQTLMTKHGFKPYDQEWWHFTLKNEPFPKMYFDFPVQ